MLAIRGGTVLTITKGVIEKGVVLIDKGRIVSVGKRVAVPRGSSVIDAEGQFVTPGLVDAHCHLGVYVEGVGAPGHDGNETLDPVTPHLRALDGVNPRDRAFADARAGGVTTACVAPGSANVIGGQAVTLKTAGEIVDEMVLSHDGGLKVAFGENPKFSRAQYQKPPTTRMGVAGMLRKMLADADNYRKKKRKERDLGLEVLVRVLERKLPLRVHAHQTNDIVTAVRIAKEFNCRLSIEHCTEGHLIAGFLARNRVPCAVGPTTSPRVKVELMDRSFRTPADLAAAGVEVSIISDHPVIRQDLLPLCAALAVKHGLSEDDALRAVTVNPARLLGVQRRVGSLERGKDADLVLWSGHPLDVMSRVEMTFVNGVCVHGVNL